MSPRLEERFPDETSEAAREGTLAHSFAEEVFRNHFGETSDEEYRREYDRIHDDDLYSEEMDGYVASYTDAVIERYNGIKGDKEIHFEERLDFSRWVTGGFGTGDVVIISENNLTIIDLKYGKGIKVDAYENPQLMLYGLGLINEYEMAYHLETVTMVIIQPRLDHISEYSISADELLAWGEDVVKPAAALTESDEAECNPGPWCSDNFCRARHTCRARAEKAMEVAKKKFPDPNLLEDDEVAEYLGLVDQIAKWCNELKDYAVKSALDGKVYEGWKVVEGISRRKITDEDGLVKRLKEEGYDEAILYKRVLLGLTELEGVVGKKAFKTLSEGFVGKPKGKPTLAPESDKREPYDRFDKFDKED